MNKKIISLILLIIMLMMTSMANAQTQDSDNDGIPDTEDSCPHEPGPPENRGCPLETPEPPPPTDDTGGSGDNNNPSDIPPATELPPPPTPSPIVTLVPMPTDGQCVVSPAGLFSVNVREYPLKTATVLTVLQVNELAPVLDVVLDIFYAEPEWISENLLWYKIEHNNIIGWVAGNVVRLGGDCDDFVIPTVFSADEVLAPNAPPPPFSGGVFVATGDITGDGSDFSPIITFGLGDDTLIYPYRTPDQPHGVIINLIGKRVLVDKGGRLPMLDIRIGNGASTPSLPLTILVCDEVSDDDCLLLTTSTQPLLVDLDALVCLTTENWLKCLKRLVITEDTRPTSDCTTIGDHIFCPTEELPEACAITAAGTLICNVEWQLQIIPFNPQHTLPSLTILNPTDEPARIGLLLPAVQK